MIPLHNYKDHRKDEWFNYIQEAVRLQQDREIWVSESKVSFYFLKSFKVQQEVLAPRFYLAHRLKNLTFKY